MKRIAVSQRVDIVSSYEERRDALDQRWYSFLFEAGLLPLLVPNNLRCAEALLATESIDGILLTGGNDLVEYGGSAKERDSVERFLLERAIEGGVPLLGVCRGMQMLQHYFGATLQPVEGHVQRSQTIVINGELEEVNSFHDYGASQDIPCLSTWAHSDDGVIKAVRHVDHRITGIMWHPEKNGPFPHRRSRPVHQYLPRGSRLKALILAAGRG